MLHLDSGAENWLYKTARKNFWKVEGSYTDWDDIVQDGYLYWYVVVDRYSHITDRGHLMRLFQMTYYNHITWLASRDKDKQFNIAKVTLADLAADRSGDYSDAYILDNILSSQGIDALDMNQFIVESPEPVRSVLKLLTSDQGPRILSTPYRRYLDGTRQTLNHRLCRHLHLEQGNDVLGKTKAHLMEIV